MPAKQKYQVLRGLNYLNDTRRAEAGSVVDDIPASAAKWMLAGGDIVETDLPLRDTTPAAGQAFLAGQVLAAAPVALPETPPAEDPAPPAPQEPEAPTPAPTPAPAPEEG